MSKNDEEQIREMLSHAAPSTVQELEDEIMGMLAALKPHPILIERVRGLFIEEHGFSSFVVSDEYDDIAYSWEVGGQRDISPSFTVALYLSLNVRSELLPAHKIGENAARQIRENEQQRLLIQKVQSMHKVAIKLFDGTEVMRVVRRKSYIYYRGKLMHITGFFTLDQKKHEAMYLSDTASQSTASNEWLGSVVKRITAS